MSQIFQWIKDQEDFINKIIQPEFDKFSNLSNKSAMVCHLIFSKIFLLNYVKYIKILKILFSNALICLVGEKLEYDIKSLIKNPKQFSHTIDEIIHFDTQIKGLLKELETDFNNKHFSLLHILCENNLLFLEWINLERIISQKKIDSIFTGLNSESDKNNITISSLINQDRIEIWGCNYSDVDQMKPSHCAESFVLILRYFLI